jgi:hypothetical protein
MGLQARLDQPKSGMVGKAYGWTILAYRFLNFYIFILFLNGVLNTITLLDQIYQITDRFGDRLA